MNAITDPLLAEVENFLTESGMTPTAFGVKALGDPRFVPGLRQGRECRRATRERVRSFIADFNATAATQTSEAA